MNIIQNYIGTVQTYLQVFTWREHISQIADRPDTRIMNGLHVGYDFPATGHEDGHFNFSLQSDTIFDTQPQGGRESNHQPAFLLRQDTQSQGGRESNHQLDLSKNHVDETRMIQRQEQIRNISNIAIDINRNDSSLAINTPKRIYLHMPQIMEG